MPKVTLMYRLQYHTININK